MVLSLIYNVNMFKLLGGILLIGASVLIISREKIGDYKQKVIEVINPAAKEKRLLGELETNFDQLGSIINSGNLASADKQKLTTAMGNIKSTLVEFKETNQKTDLGANLSNLLQKIVPFDLEPSPTWLPPSLTAAADCLVEE